MAESWSRRRADGGAGGAARLARLPGHLKRHLVSQGYERYTSQDHAVWRYILRRAVRLLSERAHPSYLEGLRATGIGTERIPRIEEMNEILSRLGWAAACVDGFIPPAAFMELQAHRVLVIAADMRQVGHVAYTPAPDIVHEAAGHAPIIVDRAYAEYLRRIGEVGARAMSSRADFELYEAIRRLSQVKEQRGADPEALARAEREVAERQRGLGAPSEMALVSRLHWWTVEYGLVGPLERPRIYGAGLLSSLGEAETCLGPEVRKLPYTLEAAQVAYDITRKQPQLFVTPDFERLSEVLERFEAGLAWRVGGLEGLRKAVECRQVATAVWSSGLEVSGVFQEPRLDARGRLAYVRTAGPTALALGGEQLPGQGRDAHREGFGAPAGPLAGAAPRVEGLKPGQRARLPYASGVVVEGQVAAVAAHGGEPALVKLRECTVRWGDEVLFRPEWGDFDLPVGEGLVSVFAGAADQDAYEQPALVSRQRTVKHEPTEAARALHALYAEVRHVREQGGSAEGLGRVWAELQARHPDDWLLPLELLELVREREPGSALERELRGHLARRAREPGLGTLVGDGLECR